MTTPEDGALAASVHARCQRKYQVELNARSHPVQADEPLASGGGDTAPTPLELLASALAACTAITLRMYAERKGWRLGAVTVRLKLFREETGIRVERDVAVGGELDDDQRARLADICERTPVTLALKSGIEIRTTLE